ncbi:MAG: efflux RND transporter periplasmic adaptor subunit [Acidobacteria bacterium]|jgi:multidrug efflux system membrane fusion protein|nr:efflux RND transporter periplasmic adaptor subunit [Acidobacteriota bacterium]MCU0253805.1 efflux RND transporter periplasmic adaptor subunit [Acidobacteriota bacterium]
MSGRGAGPGRAAPALLLALTVLPACGKGAGTAGAGAGAGSAGAPAIVFPVEVARVAVQPVEYRVAAVGSVEAFETVQVTARVSGVVDKVDFAEGMTVTTGQKLAEIEPDRYRVQVDSARATLARTEASLEDAKAGLRRREQVNTRTPGLVKEEDLETYRTRVRVAEADVTQARSALDLALLNQRDAVVRAPTAGTIETRRVETGQYVQPGSVIATLLRREPLLLRFKVAESEAPSLRDGMQAQFTVKDSPRTFGATITLVGGAAEESSRMVAVTARIDDPLRGQLRPGQFAEVSVPVGRADRPVIPETAIRPSERGFLAYVVEGDKAQVRILQLGMRTADGRVEVRDGLAPGEALVVRGAEALRDGASVQVAGGKQP